jgi:hypothetical protein
MRRPATGATSKKGRAQAWPFSFRIPSQRAPCGDFATATPQVALSALAFLARFRAPSRQKTTVFRLDVQKIVMHVTFTEQIER